METLMKKLRTMYANLARHVDAAMKEELETMEKFYRQHHIDKPF
jgi:hypothetical protein